MKFSFIAFPFIGIVINDGLFVRRYRLLPWPRLSSLNIVGNYDDAARVFRRTMKPNEIVRCADGSKWILVCYPYAEVGGVRVLGKRDVFGEFVEINCESLRPINFAKRVGIPACDPQGV